MRPRQSSRRSLLAGLALHLAAPCALAQDFQFSPVTKHYYTVLGPRTWSAGEAAAAQLGGHLAAITSDVEQNWLISQYANLGEMWIGLHDRFFGTYYQWTTGEYVGFTAWLPGEPSLGAFEDVVTMDPTAQGGWRDRDEHRLFPALVELDRAPVLATATIEGAGCANPNDGRVPRLAALSVPFVGAGFVLQVDRLPALSLGLLLLGVSASPSIPVPPPYDLPGCMVLVNPGSAVSLFLPASLTGTATLSLTVPAQSSLYGVELHAQDLALVTVQGQPKVVVSNGLSLHLGGASDSAEVAEAFHDESFLDRDASSGAWHGGTAVFGVIGGDGAHGEFDPSIGTNLGVIDGVQTWSISTDHAVIPASHTISGSAVTVTDDRFRFSNMHVAAGTRIVFTGNNPLVLDVRGSLVIEGELASRGQDNTWYASNATTIPGQPGTVGGASAGAGGSGGDKCSGTGGTAANAGQNGQDCRVPAGHGFAGSVAGTGGLGSPLFPASGLVTSIVFNIGTVPYTVMATSGGGGGGYLTRGGQGRVIYNTRTEPRASGTSTGGNTAFTLNDTSKAWTWNEWVGYRVAITGGTGVGESRLVTANTSDQLTVDQPWTLMLDTTTAYQLPLVSLMGPPTSGGIPLPHPSLNQGNARSSLHYLIGGSGGGGGGSEPLFSSNFAASFAPGCGGGGGGGSIALRAGDRLAVTAVGALVARGGAAGSLNTGGATTVTAAPAGGGSGGTILLQSGNAAAIAGLVDVRGGTGGYFHRGTALTPAQGGGTCEIAGGDGSPGFIRFETPVVPQGAVMPNAQPPLDWTCVGALNEVDDVTGFRSRWYRAGIAAPTMVRYVIVADVAGVRTVFSDDPAYGTPARGGLAPIAIWLQGADMDVADNLYTGTITPWRTQVGAFSTDPPLAGDHRGAFRFELVIDRTLGLDVVVHRVALHFRP